ncbi:hypothetical protein [uncultured Paraglaciecola sp.]|uniref:hypothetical protein n=1 Tax=uncultured Paraglaciecola sp. TaxID=1765024 RepID=UPI002626CF80|nr:hypothetical protein [uncultured Paraglaciecola sp.]
MSDKLLQNFENKEEISKTKPNGIFQRITGLVPTTMITAVRKKLSLLTLSQWMYLAAGLLLLMQQEQSIEQTSEVLLVGAIAALGLIRELWHVFNRVWEHMLGKGLILVLYAATANFALAVSALKINVITGIEPQPFIFTLGFVTLIMLPFWMLLSSIVFFSVALIVGNLWLVIGILLRLIRVKIKVHWEDKSFVFITMILRIILIPYVIMSLLYIALPYAKQIELFEQSIAFIKKIGNEEQTSGDNPPLVIEESESENLPATLSNTPFILSIDQDNQIKWIDKLIAGFIYHFETYPKSACKKPDEQRSLPIDENSILLVQQDDSELGYFFSVGPCVGNFSNGSQPTKH